MHTLWAWITQLPIAEITPLSSTVGWGLAVGSVATLVALPRIARAKRSLSKKSPRPGTALSDAPSDGPEHDAAVALASIPQSTQELFEDPSALQVALPALLLCRHDDRSLLEATSRPQYTDAIRSMWELLGAIEPRERVALIDKALTTLAGSSTRQAKQVLQFLDELQEAAVETHWQFQAWCQLAKDAVAPPQRPKRLKHSDLISLLQEMLELISIMAITADDDSLPAYRFHRGWSYLELPHARALPADVLAFSDLESALAKASRTPPLLRARICNACMMALTTDGSLDESQVAMVRLIRQRLGHRPLMVLPGKLLR